VASEMKFSDACFLNGLRAQLQQVKT